MKNSIKQILICFMIALLPSPAMSGGLPCDPLCDVSPTDTAARSKMVFVGRVLGFCTNLDDPNRVERYPSTTTILTVQPLAVWKGDPGTLVEVRNTGMFVSSGEKYLIYADDLDGQLFTNCRSGRWDEAYVDRFYLGEPSSHVSGFQIRTPSLEDLVALVIDGYWSAAFLKEFHWLQQYADELVPIFGGVVRSERRGSTRVATAVLGCMGAPGRAHLEWAVSNGSPEVRKQALYALGRFGEQ